MSTSTFLNLFRGNPTAVGVDTDEGRVEAVRLDTPETRALEWSILGDSHLSGQRSIGVYPYTHPLGQVAWGCVDLDEGEETSWSHAIDLYMVLRVVGITAWIERSRSKGYHVWTFVLGWTPAAMMRKLLMGACETVGAPSREVNPKQDWLEEDQLGNFVRLPYFGGAVNPPPRQVVVDTDGKPIPLSVFLNDANATRALHEDIGDAATRLSMPARVKQVPRAPRPDQPWEQRLIALAYMQLHQGPKPGSDRSSYLSALAYACAESGLEHEEIVAAVKVADEWHCHKYTDRKDSSARYDDLADRALAAYE